MFIYNGHEVWLLAGRVAAAEREERKPALRETRERILEANITEKRRQRKEGRDQDEDEMIIESNCVLRKMLRSRGGGTQTHRDVV